MRVSINKKSLRQIAKQATRRDFDKRVKFEYAYLQKAIRYAAKKGLMYIESRYFQVGGDYEIYVALRLLRLKTDLRIRIYCDDEEYAISGEFNHAKWAYEAFGSWDEKIKYTISW